MAWIVGLVSLVGVWILAAVLNIRLLQGAGDVSYGDFFMCCLFGPFALVGILAITRGDLVLFKKK